MTSFVIFLVLRGLSVLGILTVLVPMLNQTANSYNSLT